MILNIDLSLQDHLASVLLMWGKKEPNCEARCIALCSLGIFLYEELVHVTYHQRMKEAIQVLLASLKVGVFREFTAGVIFQKSEDVKNFLNEEANIKGAIVRLPMTRE